jgi:4-amino-4-deoxy-L-arabinose transferase-like glycosyltransferase
VLCAIFAVALGLRLAWLARTDTALPWLADPQYYHATAQNIAEGRGYTVALGPDGFTAGDASEATAFWAPGYPFALAPFYKLFGADIRVAKLFNAIVGALTVVPIFYVARRLPVHRRFADAAYAAAPDDRVGLLAAAMFAVTPSLVFWTSTLFSETLCTFGVAMTLAVALWAGDRRGLPAYVLAGVALAATAFVRSQAILLVVPVAILVVRNFDPRTLVRAGAAVVVGIAALVVPWAARNEVAMGRPYLINDNLGYNLRLAHAPYAKGTSVPPQDLWDEEPGITFKQREILFDDLGRERALAYARTHPGREVQLAAWRLDYLLRSDAPDALRWSLGADDTPSAARTALRVVGDAAYWVLVALAVLSIAVLPRTRAALALWSAIGVWLALHLVFAGEPRYHVPLFPVAAMLAATSAASLFALAERRITRSTRERRLRPAGEASSMNAERTPR